MYPYYYRPPGPFDVIFGPGSGSTTGPTSPVAGPSMGTPPPSFAPPSTIPPKPSHPSLPPGVYGYVPPPSVAACMYKLSYIWPSGGSQGFWFWAYYTDQNSAAGYMWNPTSQQWMKTGFDLKMIDFITCQ